MTLFDLLLARHVAGGGTGVAAGTFLLADRIQRMLGACIGSLTAFLVVNNTVVPCIVAWLLPTVFVTPLIALWTRKLGVRQNYERTTVRTFHV